MGRMARLKSRQRPIPNGFVFLQSQTGWKAPRNASFNTIVNALIAHRKGNPFLAQKHKWSLDPVAVADEVDAFNAMVCERMGYTNFIQSPVGVAPPPKFPAPSASEQSKLSAAAGQVKKIWAGVRTLNDWIDSGDPPVPAEQSAARARCCATCNKNTPGDFTTWFTKPAAEAIQKQVERISDRKLSTPEDARLNVCSVCLCPLKLKVHTPLNYINSYLSEGVLKELEKVSGCWIVEERKQ